MKRVLLIGFRSEHIQILERLYKGVFKISALTDQQCHSTCLRNVNKYDNIVVATKFTSHSIHHRCKKNNGYIMTTGGYSSVLPILKKLSQGLPS